MLTVSKRQRIPFDRAWHSAMERVVLPHRTDDRREYRDVLDSMRWAFEFAYHDQEVPGGRAAIMLAESVPDLGDHAHCYASPRPVARATPAPAATETEAA